MFSLINLIILFVISSFFLLASRLKNIILALVVLEIFLLFNACLFVVSLGGTSLAVPFFIALMVFIVIEAVIGLLIFIIGLSNTGSFFLKFSSLLSAN